MSQVQARNEWGEVDLYEQLRDEFGDRVDPQFLHVVAREVAGSFDEFTPRGSLRFSHSSPRACEIGR